MTSLTHSMDQVCGTNSLDLCKLPFSSSSSLHIAICFGLAFAIYSHFFKKSRGSCYFTYIGVFSTVSVGEHAIMAHIVLILMTGLGWELWRLLHLEVSGPY